MTQVMIYAYTANNLGDDLFIHTICTRYPNTKFLCYAPNSYQTTFNYLPNLEIIPNNRLFNKFIHAALKPFNKELYLREQLAKTCEIGVYIGGSIFMEQTGWEKEAQQVQTMKNSHDSFFILGANFGPYQSSKFYQTYEKIFQGITDICFRDHQSKELFTHLPVRQAADVVFQLKDTFSHGKPKEQILISVIYPSIRKDLKKFDDSYFKGIANISIHLINQGYDVLLMAFCQEEKDHLAMNEILSLIPKALLHKVNTYTYQTNLPEAISKLSESKAIIATRFHAMILGFVLNKPTYPIVYSNKMTTVIDDLNFKGRYSRVDTIHLINLNELNQTLNQQPIDISPFIIDAEKQFEALDALLK